MNHNDKTNCSESKLLSLCSYPYLSDTIQKNILAILNTSLDYDMLLSRARQHGMLPLLYYHVKEFKDLVPTTVFQDLRMQYLGNTSRNLVLIKELTRIISLMKEHDIPMIPFKGPLLALQGYQDISLRSFSDLDVMVHKKDVLKVKDILLHEDFVPTIPMNTSEERFVLKNDCEYNFRKKRSPVCIEVHWRFHPRLCHIPFDENIWDRLYPVNLEKENILSFSVEDLFLFLCTHATRHQWCQLRYLSDLFGLFQSQDVDLDAVYRIAREQRLLRIFFIGLFLLKMQYMVSFPSTIEQNMQRDTKAQELSKTINYRLLSQPVSYQEHHLFGFWLKSREDMYDKLMSGFHMLFSPTQIDVDFTTRKQMGIGRYVLLRPYRLLQYLS